MIEQERINDRKYNSSIILKTIEKRVIVGAYEFLKDICHKDIFLDNPKLISTESREDDLCQILDIQGIDAFIKFNKFEFQGVSNRVHNRKGKAVSIVIKRPNVEHTEYDRLKQYYEEVRNGCGNISIRPNLNIQTSVTNDIPTHTVITSNMYLIEWVLKYERYLKPDVYPDGSRICIGGAFMDKYQLPYICIEYTEYEQFILKNRIQEFKIMTEDAYVK